MKFIDDDVYESICFSQGKTRSVEFEFMPYSACSLTTSQRAVLVVEDQPAYLELICEAIEESFPDLVIQSAQNGEQAWQFLNQGDRHSPETTALTSDAPMIYPSLIISDLNLPKLSGFELLTRIKQDAYLQAIPVVIFSTSTDEQDILRCYQAQANCYVAKPSNVDDFFAVVQEMLNFWLNLAELPQLNHENLFRY